jgi:hypothetical protein
MLNLSTNHRKMSPLTASLTQSDEKASSNMESVVRACVTISEVLPRTKMMLPLDPPLASADTNGLAK